MDGIKPFILPKINRKLPTWGSWHSLAAFGLPMLVYLCTLAPTVFNLDSAELTTAAATAGLTRATGYPLYLTLGYLWTHLPIGDVGYRMNLLSAFSAALTLLLCERILQHLGVRTAPKFAALGALAFSKFFWALALIAEVYTLQTALMAFMILAVLRWSKNPTPWRLSLVGLAIGLGLSHHLATLLLLPGILFYIIVSHAGQLKNWKALGLFGAGILLGISFYVYLPLRYLAAPAFNYAGGYDETGIFHPLNLTNLKELWWLVTGRSFASAMFAYSLPALWKELFHFCTSLSGAFFILGIGPGLLGFGLLLKDNWKVGSFFILIFAAHVAFFSDYRVADKELMYLPAYMVWALCLGVGYDRLLAWVSPAGTGQSRSPRPAWLLSGLMLATVLLALGWNWSLVDLSHDYSTRERGEAILSTVEPNAIILGYWDTVPIIQYLQLVEGQRPDVQAINRFMISPENMSKLILNKI